MAVMSNAERQKVVAYINRATSKEMGALTGLTKQDITNAVIAMDDWIDVTQGTINLVFPLITRNALSLQQKTLLFCYVAMRRAGMLHVEEDS